MEGAISHGIRVGVFLYSMALDEETARQEAQYVLEQIRGYKISYPVAYDVESKYLLDMEKRRRNWQTRRTFSAKPSRMPDTVQFSTETISG